MIGVFYITLVIAILLNANVELQIYIYTNGKTHVHTHTQYTIASFCNLSLLSVESEASVLLVSLFVRWPWRRWTLSPPIEQTRETQY